VQLLAEYEAHVLRGKPTADATKELHVMQVLRVLGF
jgi:hypothetical protein